MVVYTFDGHIDGAIKGAISALEKSPDVSAVTYTSDDIELFGKQGKKIEGKYILGNQNFKLNGIFIIEKNKLWMIIIHRSAENSKLDEVSNRVIESIKIEQ